MLGVVKTDFLLDSLTRPVANMLRQTGEDVENRGFACIRLPGQSNYDRLFVSYRCSERFL